MHLVVKLNEELADIYIMGQMHPKENRLISSVQTPFFRINLETLYDHW